MVTLLFYFKPDKIRNSSLNLNLCTFLASASMAHFRVAACLAFKASPSAQPFKWKLVAYFYANQTLVPFNS